MTATAIRRSRLGEAAERGQAAKLLRGGAWNNPPINCRSAVRNSNDAGNQNDNVGLRVGRAVASALDRQS
ncbi:MAG: hypothetical protein HC910_10810 [Spirulinaceae cyanobacterium SM2_1_0]|nr:hypothetical protein [Spirulinaceae cyanobacterium SM2_1_0]